MDEDRGFDYILRDKLRQHCKENHIYLNIGIFPANQKYQGSRHDLVLDMITYSSMGNWDQAVKSVQESFKFLRTYNRFVLDCSGFLLMFEVWKNCFIRAKYSLEHNRFKPSLNNRYRIPKSFTYRVKTFTGSPQELSAYIGNKVKLWRRDSQRVHNFMMKHKKQLKAI